LAVVSKACTGASGSLVRVEARDRNRGLDGALGEAWLVIKRGWRSSERSELRQPAVVEHLSGGVQPAEEDKRTLLPSKRQDKW
jgi:hypothetical protein